MSKSKLGRGKLVAGLGALALVAGLLVLTATAVSANGGGGWWFGNRGDQESLLADELGVTVDELEAAREAARTRSLDQALADGQITQEQYDQVQLHQSLQPYLDHDALVAAALGISVDKLGEQSLGDWLDELGLDRETYQTNLQAARDAAIQRAVEDGVITQEQADTLGDTLMLGGRGARVGGMGGAEGVRNGGVRSGGVRRGGMQGGRSNGGMGGGAMPGCDPLEDSGFRQRYAPTSPDEA